jgi:para-aminobenzoate synthetase / 4-amino-4-deoxychorismate lyase
VRRVVAQPVPDLPDRPGEVLLALAHLAGPRRLTALSGAWSGTRMLLAVDPVEVVEHDELASFDEVGAVLDAGQVPLGRDPHAGDDAVGGGWLTLLGHVVGRTTGRVRTPAPPRTGPRLPAVALARYDHLLRFDGRGWWAEALDDGDGLAEARAGSFAAEAVAACAAPITRLRAGEVDLAVVPDARAHMAAVEQVVTAVRGGDIAQANVCARFGLRLPDARAAAVRAWVALVEALDPDRAALVTGPWGALVGASPELYLGIGGGRVRSAPIKGTRPAGDDSALRASVKDTSENVMIVDLVRNDLSRVCEPGSVTVDDLLAVQPHTGVAHLVSRVSGTLLPGTGPGEVVRATFPPGSVTGTPKQRATEVTEALEPAARGAHTGAVGWLGPRLADLAVTIRSLEVAPDGQAALGVGGGIVADSTPAEEWHEVLTKAAPLLRALHVTPPAPGPSTAASKGVADPGSGLIETLLAVDGRPVETADHVARLRRSYWELSGRALAVDVEAQVLAAARRAGPGAHRLRVRAALVAGPPSLAVDVEPWHAPLPVGSQPGLVLGVAAAPAHGLERHKFADRAWLDAAGQGHDDVALAAEDGLLETTRACLLAVVENPGPERGAPGAPTLVTPPADGRILPGVTRQVCVDLARQRGWTVRLGPLDDDLLADADGLVACNALRGVQWVREVGDHRWQAPSPGVRWLAEAVLRRWQLA